MTAKLRLTVPTRIPYGGNYTWKDPITKAEIIGTNFEMLIDRAYSQRKANSIPIGLNFDDEIEQDICRDYPNECEGWVAGMPRRSTMDMWSVVRGSMVMLKHKVSGSPLVDGGEANQRAAICATCPYNMQFSKPCSGLCAELQHVAQYITGSGSTPYDSDLKSCAVCSCWTKVAVWLPLDIQQSVLSEEQKTQFKNIPHCWKAKGL